MNTEWSVALVASAIAATGCNGGGEGTFSRRPPDTEHLEVVSYAPIGDSADPDVAVSITFNLAVDPQTVNPSSIQLRRGGETLAGAFQIDDTQVTFQPERRLSELSEFSVLATSLASVGGLSLDTSFGWTFGTRELEWGAPTIIDGLSTTANGASASVDSSGLVHVGWHQAETTEFSAWTTRFLPEQGWQPPELLEDGAGPAYDVRVTAASDGTAYAVWDQQTSGFRDIWGARFGTGSGWEAAERLEAADGLAAALSVVVDANGDAFTLWYQYAGARSDVWASRRDELEWLSPEEIDSEPVGSAIAGTDSIAADPVSGGAVAVWEQDDGSVRSILAARFVSGTGWQTPEPLEAASGNASDPSVVIDTAGVATAVWIQSDGSTTSVWGNRAPATGGWEGPTPLETESGDANNVSVVSFGGHTVAAWHQDSGATTEIWASRFESGGWGTPTKLLNPGSTGAIAPRLAVDRLGTVIVVWIALGTSGYDLWSARYRASEGWSEELLVDGEFSVLGQQIVVDSECRATVIWQQGNGSTEDIWAIRLE